MSNTIRKTKAVTQIFVVDDDPIVLNTLKQGLTERGYAISDFVSGELALEAYDAAPPDLVVLDLKLGEKSGEDVAREMLNREFRPVVVLSAYYDSDTVGALVEIGVAGYLVKPIEADRLVPSIEAALSRFAEVNAVMQDRTNLRAGMENHRIINTATGIIMERFELANDVAYERLRKLARDQRRPLRDVAFELLDAVSQANTLASNFKE